MNLQEFSFSRKASIAVAYAFLATTLASPAHAQDVGLPQDWSNRHLVYSNPEARDEAIKNDTLEVWTRKANDPRFVLALERRLTANVNAKVNISAYGKNPSPPSPAIHRDWSSVMGGASGVGRANTFPAKYNFGITASSCINDFVVFTTASSGTSGTSGTLANRTGTFTAQPTVGQTATVGNTSHGTSIVLTSTANAGGSNTGLNFRIGANNTATELAVTAANLAAAINRNGGTVGVTATSAGAIVTVAAITWGNAQNANITLAENISGANFAWAGNSLTGGTGTAAQPTIFAVNALYSSCGSTTQAVPATYWSYNTGTGAVADLSPVLSRDGTQVAFVQRTSANVAQLVLLKWGSAAPGGTVGVPTVPSSPGLASYRTCTAPCMAVIAFSGGTTDTNSSPFYDYAGDVIYVGADNGTLHKFTGVFQGTPAEAGAPWPVTVSSNNVLSPPVYDSASGLVFVGSARGTTTGGQLHSVNSAGTVVSSGQLAGNGTPGVSDGPIVDSTAGRVYAFVANDGSSTANNPNCYAATTSSCGAVYQFVTNFGAGTTGTKVFVGGGVNASRIMYAGAFDDAYWAGTGTSPTGSLYVCGGATSTTPGSIAPTLWRIPITANSMGTAVVGPQLVGAGNTATNGICSPILEVANGANDYVYVSVPENGNATGCSGACIYMYKLTGLTWGTTAIAAAGLAAPGGASGMVIDNTTGPTTGSQIYYATRTAPGNAVQASQAALQ